MSEMKNRLMEMLKKEGFGGFVVDSFDEAKNNSRKKNIVLLDDGIYVTFKAKVGEKNNIFGELVCWVDDEFNEDESVYTSAVNAVIVLFTYSDEELDQHIADDDLVENFTPYNMTEWTVKNLIADNEENNIESITSDAYGKGYYEGYHDALVDLMDKLGIKHNEEIYNS
ncbi:hypothetical protein bpr_II132 (plasmid) [Butyrivibrio proteoclasticus B316]|uniref:Uncharacterized protein n=1 Tax=Butyrivibrio proteoclasticus (strain ATCC 51982 / DSM 14932 / B316) TaxID=515622 RepID=E0S3T9_BUTPB|nr:hypothetical protein [Butyrivibrio proteoclasticus]ADL36071.1 hypothetical protein bpr_II132 [Butyrivibrio proteoclasticus B316]